MGESICNNCIVLFSGGKDSLVALYWAISKNFKILVLSFNYTGRPKKEIEICKSMCEKLNLEYRLIDLDFMYDNAYLNKSGHTNAKSGYIPSRNLIFYSIASSVAITQGYSKIIGGHALNDSNSYKDASYKFFSDIEKLININDNHNDYSINILLPFINLMDKQVIDLGRKLKVPFDQTWSCWVDSEKPCNLCLSCQDRNKLLNL